MRRAALAEQFAETRADLATVLAGLAAEAAVVTVGSIHGGTKYNIIPDDVHLQLTIRTYKEEVRQHILASLDRIAKGIAAKLSDMDPADSAYFQDRAKDFEKRLAEAELKWSAQMAPSRISNPRYMPVCQTWAGSATPNVVTEIVDKPIKK